MRIIKQSTAITVKCGPAVDTNGDAVTTLTIQKADVRVSKNGGNMASASADQGASDAGMPHDELGMYDMSLDTTDTNTLGHIRVTIVKTGALHIIEDFEVVTAEVWNKFYSTGELNVALSTQGKSDVNNEVVDALATDTYAEPGQGAPGATISLAAKLNYLYKSWRNKKDNDGSNNQIYNDAGDTVDHKQATTSAGGTVTKAEWITGA